MAWDEERASRAKNTRTARTSTKETRKRFGRPVRILVAVAVALILAAPSVYIGLSQNWDKGHSRPALIAASLLLAFVLVVSFSFLVLKWMDWADEISPQVDVRFFVVAFIVPVILTAVITYDFSPSPDALGAVAQVNATLIIAVILDRRHAIRTLPPTASRRDFLGIEIGLLSLLGVGTFLAVLGAFVDHGKAQPDVIDLATPTAYFGQVFGLAAAGAGVAALAVRAGGRLLGSVQE